MRFPFQHKPVVKKIVGDAVGMDRYKADSVIKGLLEELPELIAASVVDVKSNKTLSAYTALVSFDPYKLSTRNAELIRRTQKNLTAPWLAGQELGDMVVVLDEQLHCLRTTANGRWLCYVAVRLADTNMALVRDVMRRCAN
ncbi:hypothetical protein F0P96_15575 [Hymenobacter busanensis]|uniref:Uncharacterized protein n=1 Tax=Hymenobacter busanensis TaxID=2607656 RepID=A0A7L5A2W8_9BACT|nr:hypothetical protein [Hymenobacter busanensis]KAA9331651.1 hypothetical protein F0P96_15575 [Hymenobacter busanensis]QHJ08802.1 hypothetical protein GUY19_16510 [Hymenobacter busanensis]